MPISFVGSHVGTHAATSAQTVNFSSLLNEAGGNTMPATNDVVFVAVENSSTVDRGDGALVPAGYTSAHTADYRNDSNDSNFQVSYKVMGATPDTTVAIPASNATTAGVAYAIYVFRGVDTANPLDVAAVVTGAINTGVANAAAVTPVTAGAWIAAFAGAAVAAGAVFTNPAGMSATANHFRSATITTTTNDANIGGALYTGWTSGAYDPAAFGGSTSTNTGSWSAVTLALKPNDQSLAAGLFTNTQTFHAPTVTPGPVDLAPGLFTNSQAFHAATVSATYPLTPSLFTNAQTFYGPTVTQSASDQTLAPGLLANTQTFHPATVSASYSLQPALFTNAATFYGPTLTQPPFDRTIAVPLLVNVPVFLWPLVTTSGSWAAQSPVAATWTPIPDPEPETWT